MAIGLVLGAGGVAGGAFHAGVVAALHDAPGWDARHADVIVGTSAGSITATSLRAGLSPADVLARAEDRPLSPEGRQVLARVGRRITTPPLRPSVRARPSPARVASTLARAAARPFGARPAALLAGLLPDGAVETSFIAQAVRAVHVDAWPERPMWICAVRQRDGRRVVFGLDRDAAVADAVAASCAIPAFFAPVDIDGERYIDGGVHSPTNADLLASQRLDLVVVSSPMSISGRSVRFTADQPARRWSRALLDAEALRLRRKGIAVVAFQPTAADAVVMGPNAMDPRRRTAIARHSYESTLRRLERRDTRQRLAALTA